MAVWEHIERKKKNLLKIPHRIRWTKGGRLPNSLQRFGENKWLQCLISHVQFLKQNCANWCKVHGATTAAFHARNSTSGKGFHDTSTASAIKMCCNDKFSRKLYMHKNKGCSRSQHDWTAKIMQKEERNCTKDLTWWHTAVICAAQRWHKKSRAKIVAWNHTSKDAEWQEYCAQS